MNSFKEKRKRQKEQRKRNKWKSRIKRAITSSNVDNPREAYLFALNFYNK